MRLFFVVFDVALLVPHPIFELTAHGRKSIPKCHIHIGVGMVLVRRPVGNQFMPRHLQIDSNMKVVALSVVAVKLLDGDVGAEEGRVKVSQMVDLGPHPGRNGFGGFQVAKMDSSSVAPYLMVSLQT